MIELLVQLLNFKLLGRNHHGDAFRFLPGFQQLRLYFGAVVIQVPTLQLRNVHGGGGNLHFDLLAFCVYLLKFCRQVLRLCFQKLDFLVV